MPITRTRTSRRFDRDFKSLPTDVKPEVEKALRDLLSDPVPSRRRLHRLHGHRPPIYVIDVFSNHSWQITFRLDGSEAILLRVARHSTIDDAPR